MRLNVKAMAFAGALLWGVGVLLGTWWIILIDGPSHAPTVIARVYRGYNFTFAGSLIGFAWAFVDGLIGGALLAWLYNRFAGHGGSG